MVLCKRQKIAINRIELKGFEELEINYLKIYNSL